MTDRIRSLLDAAIALTSQHALGRIPAAPPDDAHVLGRPDPPPRRATNIVKHPQAGRVSIVVAQKGRSVGAVIEDDGRGFDPQRDVDGGIASSACAKESPFWTGR